MNADNLPKYRVEICGFGDLFMVLPDIEDLGAIELILPPHYDRFSIPELFRILIPQAQVHYLSMDVFVPDCVNLVKLHHDAESATGRLSPTLSYEAISRLPRQEKGDFLVVHPISNQIDRHYDYWNEIDIAGIPYKIVGDHNHMVNMDGEREQGDFLSTVSLLLASKGLVCVDSCVMHLANILRVPSVAIYSISHSYDYFPMSHCRGKMLIAPKPEEVSKAIQDLYNQSEVLFFDPNQLRKLKLLAPKQD